MPGTSNFVGELLILIGIMYQGYYIAIFAAAVGIFLCTVYSLWMYNKIIFLLPKYSYLVISDLYFFEVIVLLPLVVLMIFIGVAPASIFSLLDYSVLYYFFEYLN